MRLILFSSNSMILTLLSSSQEEGRTSESSIIKIVIISRIIYLSTYLSIRLSIYLTSNFLSFLCARIIVHLIVFSAFCLERSVSQATVWLYGDFIGEIAEKNSIIHITYYTHRSSIKS